MLDVIGVQRASGMADDARVINCDAGCSAPL